MGWGRRDKNALYRILKLLIQVFSFVIMGEKIFENTSISVMLN